MKKLFSIILLYSRCIEPVIFIQFGAAAVPGSYPRPCRSSDAQFLFLPAQTRFRNSCCGEIGGENTPSGIVSSLHYRNFLLLRHLDIPFSSLCVNKTSKHTPHGIKFPWKKISNELLPIHLRYRTALLYSRVDGIASVLLLRVQPPPCLLQPVNN